MRKMRNTTMLSHISRMNARAKHEAVIHQIGELHDFRTHSLSSRYGGSINAVYSLETSKGKFILKLNDLREYPGMFEAEKMGLETLRESKTFDIPEVVETGAVDGSAFLLLEYKEEAKTHTNFNAIFGKQLAALHKVSNDKFGLLNSNYIGSLPQYNGQSHSAAEFYLNQRLEPQFELAGKNGYVFSNKNSVMKNIEAAIPDEPASLIHGDLWVGNHLVNKEGLPCLIDPAISYGPREMDLAMMKLFGGFSTKIVSSYKTHFPLTEGFDKRISLWQLYYLLVHLNLFGTGYLNSVKRILREYE